MAGHRSIAAAGAALAFLAGSAVGVQHAEAAKPTVAAQCRGTIVLGAVKLAVAQTKALARCRNAELLGKLPPGACPNDRALITIEKTRAKLRSVVVKACGGKDGVCAAGGADDVPLADIGWDVGTCGAVGSTLCLDPIDDCDDVASCVDCVVTQTIDQAFALFYDPGLGNAAANPALRGCVRAVGVGGTQSLIKVATGFGKCWLDVNKRGSGGSFSCPDRRASRYLGGSKTTICDECGGPSGKCGGNDDVPAAAIDFPAECPAVGTCAGLVQTATDVANCVDCVNAALMDAAIRRTIPAFSLSSTPVCVP